VARDFSADPVVVKVVEFIRAGGSRPLTSAVHRHANGET
jgi:hypothetical protein